MNKQKILQNLDFLAKNDGNFPNEYNGFSTFGAETHKFALNPVILETAARDFENLHKIKLPQNYFYFITNIGNGGAGPGYGLYPLEDWSKEIVPSEPIPKNFLNTPFPHNKPWNTVLDVDNVSDEEYDKHYEEYFANAQITGSLAISHYGCGIIYLLIVCGAETGKIWVDDRGSDYGIYPAEVNFETWYMTWLEDSVNKLKERLGG